MMALSAWQWVGVGLVVWVAYDLFAGYGYSYRLVHRAEEPVHYWLMIALWSLVAGVTLWWG